MINAVSTCQPIYFGLLVVHDARNLQSGFQWAIINVIIG
jgi:hypothetical protein